MEALLRAGSLRERAGLYAAFTAKDSHQAAGDNRHQCPMPTALVSQPIEFVRGLSAMLAGFNPGRCGRPAGTARPSTHAGKCVRVCNAPSSDCPILPLDGAG